MRFAIIALLLIAPAATAAYKQHETVYSRAWCDAHGGQAEVVLDGGTRADCVTDTHAIEVERAAKWPESIGQALWYAFQTNKRAGIVVIVGPGDQRYMYRLRSVIEHNALPIDLWTVAR